MSIPSLWSLALIHMSALCHVPRNIYHTQHLMVFNMWHDPQYRFKCENAVELCPNEITHYNYTQLCCIIHRQCLHPLPSQIFSTNLRKNVSNLLSKRSVILAPKKNGDPNYSACQGEKDFNVPRATIACRLKGALFCIPSFIVLNYWVERRQNSSRSTCWQMASDRCAGRNFSPMDQGTRLLAYQWHMFLLHIMPAKSLVSQSEDCGQSTFSSTTLIWRWRRHRGWKRHGQKHWTSLQWTNSSIHLRDWLMSTRSCLGTSTTWTRAVDNGDDDDNTNWPPELEIPIQLVATHAPLNPHMIHHPTESKEVDTEKNTACNNLGAEGDSHVDVQAMQHRREAGPPEIIVRTGPGGVETVLDVQEEGLVQPKVVEAGEGDIQMAWPQCQNPKCGKQPDK